MIRYSLIILTLTLLSACSSVSVPSASIPVDAKVIGIIPAFPDKFRLVATGITVFENSYEAIDIPEWRVNDAIFDAAKAALSSRFTVIRPKVDDLVRETKAPLAFAMGARANIETQIEQIVHPDQPVDVYLIFSEDNRSMYSNVPWPAAVWGGTGISKMKQWFYTEDPELHCNLTVYMVDGRTIKKIYESYLLHPANDDKRMGHKNAPFKTLKNLDWRGQWSEYSDTEKRSFQDQLVQLVKESVAYTISEMKLGK